jgi:hypothetical protein
MDFRTFLFGKVWAKCRNASEEVLAVWCSISRADAKAIFREDVQVYSIRSSVARVGSTRL